MYLHYLVTPPPAPPPAPPPITTDQGNWPRSTTQGRLSPFLPNIKNLPAHSLKIN